ncbi:phospholipase [Hyphomonas sp. WL0036]|uniref:phospholipase n=1 Tax=Hyphomonas sediminis TaxID=2866160 RepID=UPI001C803527|nr:phospholipase [Hyphomonas sediminis]MBY9065450.1 phospholipase [Hyphomonas sediminis]
MAALILLSGCSALLADAEPRARESTLASAAVLAAQQPLDACGGRDVLDSIVPDGPFLQACKFHDACYRSGALDQGRCDADFLADMRGACDTEYPATSATAANMACRVAAATYYKAVNSRFGSMLYPGGKTEGTIRRASQRLIGKSAAPHLEACADVTNTANRKLRYYLTLHDAKGQWIATAPAMKSAPLQPGETTRLCAGTGLSWFRNAGNIGPAYALTLKADDPSTLNPFGDLVSLDRIDCDTATGACHRVAP